MKFRRILAAMLSALMLTSVMSFSANVSAVESSLIKESTYHQKYGAERGQTSVQMYDEVNDIVFSRMTPSTNEANASKSCYINISGQTIAPTAEQIANDSVYVVFYVRTNMTMDENDLPSLNLYNAYWGPDAIKSDGTCSLVTGNENFIEQVGNDWGTMCFKLNTRKTISGTEYSINKWTQFAFLALGTATTKPISEWFTSVPEGVTPNVDCAGYAVLSSLEAAEAYDFEVSAQPKKITLTFDTGLAEDDSDVETVEDVVIGKWTGAKVEFPEIKAPSEDYELVGWFTDAEYQNKIEDTAAVTVPDADTTYYALWQDNSTPPTFALDSMTVNGLDASGFGADITAETIAVTLPYGWAKLEALDVMPVITVQATAPASAEYVAGATLADGGKIKFTQGKYTDEVDVTFTIGTASAKTKMPTAGVYSTNGDFTDKEGNTIKSTRAAGLVSEKATLNGVEAYKHTPVYKGSDLDGVLTKEGGTEYYTSNRGVSLEGYNAFGLYDYESYEVYRALCYIDTGANGEFDVVPQPLIYFQSSDTTGTVKTNGLSNSNGLAAVNNYVGNRWEYIYFVKGENTAPLYGKARQPVFAFFGVRSDTKASSYTDDVFYCAEVTALTDAPEYVQYQPTGLVATDVDGDILGTISGLSDDMEVLDGEEWVAITEFEGYANGKLSGLEAGNYSFRYAATENLGASEAVTVKILPGSVAITFDAQNGEEAATTKYEFDADVTVPAAPAKGGYIFKGWAEEIDGEVVDLTGLKATEEKTYYAIWEKIEVVYVKASADASGNGLTAESPFKTLAEAAAIAYNYGGTIVIMDDVAWSNKVNGQNNYNYVYNDVVITSVDPVTGTDYPGALVQTTSLNFDGDFSAKITIRDIEIASWRFGSAADKWQYINFRGHPIEFDNVRARTGLVPEGYSIGQTSAVTNEDANAEKYFPLHMRAQGENADKGYGHKILIGDTDFTSIVLGGKVPYEESTNWYKSDIDLVFTGTDKSTLAVANDTLYSTVDGKRHFKYGRFNNVKLLFETSPKSIYMSNISGIDGTYRVIANNGAVVNVPAFTYTRTDDTTTNADGSAYTADLTPKGGFWQINSAEGGRVDFTEEDNVFAVTTDAEFIEVTNKADGTTRKIRVADGVEGEANLFDEDGAYLLTLDAGEYDIAYTDEAVKVTVVFENGDNDETYEVAKGEKAIFAGTVEAPAGKVLAGWQTENGELVSVNNEYIADTYSAEPIVLYPVFADDASVPYYYIYGEYDKINATYTVDVKIANGKFTAGTFGLEYYTFAIELADDGIVMGEGVQNYLGNGPEITKVETVEEDSGLAMIVWNAASGIVDASENEVTLATFTFDVIDTDKFDEFFGGDENGWFNVSSYDYNNWEFDEVYEKYYNGEYYLVSPENTSDNPYAVDYVPAYFGDIVDTEKSYEKAQITFNVTFASKEGATAANIGELVVIGDDGEFAYAIDDVGNENATVTQVVEEFYVGDTFEFYVHKNGYMVVDVIGYDAITAEDGLVINITLLAGDIKGNTEDCCGDGEITLADFVRVVRAFDETARDEYRALVDINEDGAVTVADLAIIKANFNKTSDDNTVEYGE